MEITPKQQRNMYAIFIGLFAVNVIITIWNSKEQHLLRKLQKETEQEKLKQLKGDGKKVESS